MGSGYTDSDAFLRSLEDVKGGGDPELTVLKTSKGVRAETDGVTEEDLKDLTDEQKRVLWFVFLADGRPNLKLVC